jgi:hypothetical protein
MAESHTCLYLTWSDDDGWMLKDGRKMVLSNHILMLGPHSLANVDHFGLAVVLQCVMNHK